MSYIGNQSQTAYSAMVKQDITGNGGTSYTLSHPVSNENDILLYINNVKQEGGSGKAFTASGTTLTLSEAIANTDSCYVQYIGLAIQTTVPPDGSVSTAKIADDAVNLTSKVTGVLPVANGGTGVSSPILLYARKSNGNVSTASTIIWNTEMVDTAGAYNNTTGVFTCPKSGHYEVHWHYLHRFPGYLRTTLQKNGTYIWGSGQQTIVYNRNVDSTDESQVSGMAIVNCSVNDTLSIYFVNRGGTSDIYGEQNSHNGFLVKFLG